MAHVYAGELSKIDPQVLHAVQQLPDTFWVFAEFHIGRNADWFIVRREDDGRLTLMLTEVKRSVSPLRGDTNGVWSRQTPAGAWQDIPPHGKDINHFWQAVNTAGYLSQWLWNNQRRFRDDVDLLRENKFTVSPVLLVLSPPKTVHRLPVMPHGAFGHWFFKLSDWLAYLQTRTHKHARLTLAELELEAFAGSLNLLPLSKAAAAPSLQELQEAPPADGAAAGDDEADAPLSAREVLVWVTRLQEQMEDVQRQVGELRATASLAPRATAAIGAAAPLPDGTAPSELGKPSVEKQDVPVAPPTVPAVALAPDATPLQPVLRPLTLEERTAIAGALREIRILRRKRTPAIVANQMGHHLGYDLQKKQFNGFGSACALFEQACADHVIVFGPELDGERTIYLPDEEIPACTPQHDTGGALHPTAVRATRADAETPTQYPYMELPTAIKAGAAEEREELPV